MARIPRTAMAEKNTQKAKAGKPECPLWFAEGEAEKIEQGGKTEGFLEILSIFRQLCLRNTLGVAGHINDLDVWTKGTNFGGEVRAAEAGHHDVRKQDRNLALMGLRKRERVLGASRLQNGVTGLAKDFADGVAKGGFVVNQKNCRVR